MSVITVIQVSETVGYNSLNKFKWTFNKIKLQITPFIHN